MGEVNRSGGRPVRDNESHKVREARRMPGLTGAVLDAANLSRRRQNERWAAEAAADANAAPRPTAVASRHLGSTALGNEQDRRDDPER